MAFTITHYRGTSGNYMSFGESATSRVISREFRWVENHPKELTIVYENLNRADAENMLSTSFAGWNSGTGAIGVGDRINYYIYPTSTKTSTLVFMGVVTSVEGETDGTIILEAKDWLEVLENIYIDKVFFEHFIDKVQKCNMAHTHIPMAYSIPADIVMPPVKSEYLVNDSTIDFGYVLGGDNNTSLSANGDKFAQSFIATGAVYSFVVKHQVIEDVNPVHGHLRFGIQTDTGSNAPDGTWLAYADLNCDIPTGWVDFGADLTVETGDDSTSHIFPCELEPGGKYWFVVQVITHAFSQGHVNISWEADAVYASDYATPLCYDYTSSAWHEHAGNITGRLSLAEYNTISSDDTYFIPAGFMTDPCLGFASIPGTWNAVNTQWAYDVARARVSYYYGTVNLHDVFDGLIGFCASTANTPADISRTLPIYRTKGRSIGECLRELCDLVETTGDWVGSQYVVAHYYDAGNKIGIRRRKNIDDDGASPTFEFADGDRVMAVQLKKSGEHPNTVMVIGKTPDGYPVCASRDDRALSGSLRTLTGIPMVKRITDDSVRTLQEASDKAYALLDAYNRDEWEGTITLDGVYPDLFDLTTDNDTYGSGQIITLDYAPLGVSDLTLKVVGVRVTEFETEVTVTNHDAFVDSPLVSTVELAKISDAFSSPTDGDKTIFFPLFKDAVVDDTTLYMELQGPTYTPVQSQTRILCTKMSNTKYNLNTYHAEFEALNAITDDGEPIERVALFENATGGSAVSTYILTTVEQFYKWKDCRLIVDFNTKIA